MPFPDLQTLLQTSSSSRQHIAVSLLVCESSRSVHAAAIAHLQADLRRYAAHYHD